jgi:hypothetical protein
MSLSDLASLGGFVSGLACRRHIDFSASTDEETETRATCAADPLLETRDSACHDEAGVAKKLKSKSGWGFRWRRIVLPIVEK